VALFGRRETAPTGDVVVATSSERVMIALSHGVFMFCLLDVLR
jgi:hypothetical protein